MSASHCLPTFDTMFVFKTCGVHYDYCLSPDTTMKATVISLLLCILIALAEVQSMTFPFISFMGTNISNHSFINFPLVGDDASSSVQCHTGERHIGGWYSPSGITVSGGATGYGLFQMRKAKRVDLHRDGIFVTSGVYRCEVDTNATNNDNKDVIFVGLYESGGQYRSEISICVCYRPVYGCLC